MILNGVASWTDADHANTLGPVYLRASGVDGVQPTFSVARPNNWANLNQHPFFYSYDQQNWQPFDQSFTQGQFRRFTNDEPFSQDDVYVSYAIPNPFSRT